MAILAALSSLMLNYAAILTLSKPSIGSVLGAA